MQLPLRAAQLRSSARRRRYRPPTAPNDLRAATTLSFTAAFQASAAAGKRDVAFAAALRRAARSRPLTPPNKSRDAKHSCFAPNAAAGQCTVAPSSAHLRAQRIRLPTAPRNSPAPFISDTANSVGKWALPLSAGGRRPLGCQRPRKTHTPPIKGGLWGHACSDELRGGTRWARRRIASSTSDATTCAAGEDPTTATSTTASIATERRRRRRARKTRTWCRASKRHRTNLFCDGPDIARRQGRQPKQLPRSMPILMPRSGRAPFLLPLRAVGRRGRPLTALNDSLSRFEDGAGDTHVFPRS